MSNVLDALIGRVYDTDPALAAAILAEVKKLQNRREYGLVYEAHAPEGVRLWGKKVSVGDVVNVLPPRGVMEINDNSLEWKVVSINRKDKIAHVIRKISEDTYDEKDASVDDLVVYADFRQTIYPGLVEVDRVECGEKNDSYHVVINGENFHALQAMLWCYAGKVDCIYIDPPYNTGSRDWKYNNDYVDGNDQYRHSKWLSFMEQRLKLAKKLLNPKDSVLIVTIDEKEYLRLGMLLEQMFPEARMQMISSVINPAGAARDKQFFRTDEYIYVVGFGESSPLSLPLGDGWLIKKMKVLDGLYWRSLCRAGSNSNREDRPNLFYPIYVSNDGSHIVEIGKPIPLNIDRHTVTNKKDCITCFPLHIDGSEATWQLSNTSLEDALKLGYVKLGNLTERGVSIKYLNRKEINKIESGNIKVTGYDKNGAVITDDSTFVRQDIPGTQWRLDSHNARTGGTEVLESG